VTASLKANLKGKKVTKISPQLAWKFARAPYRDKKERRGSVAGQF
jgi:hypothetical protein